MVTEKRKPKQRKRQDEEEKPTKEEYAVAKFLRFNVPSKEGKLMGMTVQYFIASKAVDALMESKWSASKTKSDPLFTTRASCVAYCNNLLLKGIFHRASRVDRKKEREKRKKKAEEEGGKEEKSKKEKKKKTKEEKDESEVKTDEKDQEEKESKEEKKEEKKDEEKKKKKEKKLKLEMYNSLGQEFKDGDEVYVWIYDPVPFKTFCIGLLLVLGAIGVCLFPLWPPEVRLGVYYLCLAAAGFVGFILALCVIRVILFCVVWTVTFGKHHFWFLPNLTEDVGFFDSFKPLYKHNVCLSKNDEKSVSQGEEKSKEKGEEDSKDKNEKDESGSEQGYEIVNPEDVEEEKKDGEERENVGEEEDDGEEQDDVGEEEEGGEEEEEKEFTEPKKTR